MPGVLITEALAQTGAVAILSMEENKGKNALFGGIDKMKFKKMVVPGDTLKLEVKIIKKKDYIREPKKSGYQSLHLILEVAIAFQNETQWIKIELQLRTAAMDYWANLDHQLRYKRGRKEAQVIDEELQQCATVISSLDQKMLKIRKKIDKI